MPERVTVRVLEDAGLAQRALDGTLDDGLVQVMAAALAGESLHVVAARREHPLPPELAAGAWVLPRQPVGPGAPASAGRCTTSTTRYKNKSALSAWFWVGAATRPSTASEVRNRAASGAPMSTGCCLAWKKM